MERLDLLDSIEGIRKGMAEFARGEGRPSKEIFDELKSEVGLA